MEKSIAEKKIAILGSTGSIGTQALEVIRSHRNRYRVIALTANNNVNLLIEQCMEFRPLVAVISNPAHYQLVKDSLTSHGIKVLAGLEAISEIMEIEEIEIVLTAMVGFSGLKPTLTAARHGKDIAIANKETLVVAGELVTSIAKQNGINILPVDSEHSAIFQCLLGEADNRIEKIYLTASGGPFKGKNKEQLINVTPAQALKHPNWDMGAKITIDSATMMNKGLEVIEAKWLFDLNPDQIDVVIHPQSIIHSMVQFEDGSIKAQLGLPDMRLPIQFALSYPDRYVSSFPRFNFAEYPAFTFEKPDMDTFRNLTFAFEALNKGGNLPCIMNAANEVAVAAFLKEKIGFLQISDVIEKCMLNINFMAHPEFEDYLLTDKETRILAQEIIN